MTHKELRWVAVLRDGETVPQQLQDGTVQHHSVLKDKEVDAFQVYSSCILVAFVKAPPSSEPVVFNRVQMDLSPGGTLARRWYCFGFRGPGAQETLAMIDPTTGQVIYKTS